MRNHVFLVHGTWGYDDEVGSREKPWYDTGSEFAHRLRAILSEGSQEGGEWELRESRKPPTPDEPRPRLEQAFDDTNVRGPGRGSLPPLRPAAAGRGRPRAGAARGC